MEEYQNAHVLSIFLSMPGREVSTHGVVLDALKSGKSVFIPYLHSSEKGGMRQMDMLELRDETDLNALKSDAWGIPSLDANSIGNRRNALGGIGVDRGDENGPVGPELDLILMPAVTFDRSHRRLGHGKGFYDRYLERLDEVFTAPRARKPLLGRLSSPFLQVGSLADPHPVGLALSQQLLPAAESVPTDRTDRGLDLIVTPDGTI